MKELVDNSNATATDLANWLVQNLGYSFRNAYKVTGKIVTYCNKNQVNIIHYLLRSYKNLIKKLHLLLKSFNDS